MGRQRGERRSANCLQSAEVASENQPSNTRRERGAYLRIATGRG